MTTILGRMLEPGDGTPGLPILDLTPWLLDDADALDRVTAAFLVAAAGPGHRDHDRAVAVLAAPGPGQAGYLAAFYRIALARIAAELDRVTSLRPGFAERLATAPGLLGASTSPEETWNAIWRVFFPQAVGLLGNEELRVRELRAARTVTVTRLARDPMTNPARDVLFTSNVLLTTPPAGEDIGALPYPRPLRDAIATAAAGQQRYWFDHPIELGVEPVGNELLYGLRGLDEAVDAEPDAGRVTCLLSVSARAPAACATWTSSS